MMSQASPIVLITGASKGIGAELVNYFLKNTGLLIVAVSRSKPEYLVSDTGDFSRLHYHQLDLSSVEEIIQFAAIVKKLGKVSYIINNAGLLMNKPFSSFTYDEIHQIMAVNFYAPAMLVRELLPNLTRPAHIVNITSMGGFQGSSKFPGLSIYSASKGALNILSECLAEELKHEQIYINALALGAVQTEMLEQAFPGYKAPVTPIEMAKYIADFTLNGYQLMNGKVLPVSLNTP